jgi:hypothetical protein
MLVFAAYETPEVYQVSMDLGEVQRAFFASEGGATREPGPLNDVS